MDEAANIAPLRELPRHLSQAAGHGIRIATVWQTIAQLEERYRTAADTILANSTTKIFMGPITDEPTQRLLRNNLDGTTTPLPAEHGETRRLNTAGAARQLERDRALVLAGSSPTAVIETRPWWQTPTIRRRAEIAVAS
ncbi:MAG: TraM recognition domain-containing protein [Baekduia sp.]